MIKIKCKTDLGFRRCDKFLGEFDVLVGWLYCKGCKQKNYYEVVTQEGLQKTRTLL